MCKMNHKLGILISALALVLLGGCSAEQDAGTLQDGDLVPVRLEVNGSGIYTRAPGDAALSVNRILILPFKKTDESATNDAANFAPLYSAAKQLNVNSFPAISTKLNLPAASTYQIMIIGYNQTDFDFSNQGSASRKFNIGGAASPVTLANFWLNPVNAPDVPEFFTCMGNAYLNSTLVGNTFKPEQINQVQGTLTRVVSGFTLDISNIPGYVSSVKLVAEQLVTATRATDGMPLAWQTAGDSGVKLLDTKTPVAGTVSFSKYLLATPDARKTLFYLDVTYGIFTERYTMKVADTPGVSSGNRIIFAPNHWVKITGDYAKINLGFIITDNINLDDGAWDGLQ